MGSENIGSKQNDHTLGQWWVLSSLSALVEEKQWATEIASS